MSTSHNRLSCLVVATAATLLMGVVDASAQRIEIVHAFPASPQVASGKLLELAPGVFIGTSYEGGAYGQGSVYLMYRRLDQNWATYTLHSFYDIGGRHPAAGVIRASDGNFYGTTVHGGINNAGTIFRLTPSLKFSTMHAFTNVDGERPATSLVQAPDGSLWGTTSTGGGTNANAGTAFRMTLTGQFTKVHTFGGLTGGVPGQLLLSSVDGHFYGTTAFGEGGGINGNGTVFRLTQAGVLSTLHRFAEDGVDPFTMIEAADGHLYGVRRAGGATSVGFAFRITRDGVFTKLHDFDAFVDGVWYPVPGSFVQAPDGFIYGTTSTRLVGDTPVFEGGTVYECRSQALSSASRTSMPWRLAARLAG